MVNSLQVLALGLPIGTLSIGLESVVRREPNRIHLSSSGALMQERAQIDDTLREEVCNLDYIEGKPGTTNCTNVDADGADITDEHLKHELIESETTCEYAAHYTNAQIPQTCTGEGDAQTCTRNLVLDSQLIDTDKREFEFKRPRGCYRQYCGASADSGGGTDKTKMCYKYNGIGDWPDVDDNKDLKDILAPDVKEDFAPMCKRPRNVNGTLNSKDTCPSGYAIIKDEDTCRAAANCMGFSVASGDTFLIGQRNASQTLDHPFGCFMDSDTEIVHYNPGFWTGEEKADGTKDVIMNTLWDNGGSSVITGMPLCNVTTIIRWGAGDAGGTAINEFTGYNGDHDAHAATLTTSTPAPTL